MAKLLDGVTDDVVAASNDHGSGRVVAETGMGAVGTSVRAVSPAARSEPAAQHYAWPVHMPVLFNTRVLWEMEERWPDVFRQTRAHHRRQANEIELNFFYHNYLQKRGYPTARHTVRSFRIGYHLIEKCGLTWGAAACNASLNDGRYEFVTYNDGGDCTRCYRRAVRQLRTFMRKRFGVFDT